MGQADIRLAGEVRYVEHDVRKPRTSAASCHRRNDGVEVDPAATAGDDCFSLATRLLTCTFLGRAERIRTSDLLTPRGERLFQPVLLHAGLVADLPVLRTRATLVPPPHGLCVSSCDHSVTRDGVARARAGAGLLTSPSGTLRARRSGVYLRLRAQVTRSSTCCRANPTA